MKTHASILMVTILSANLVSSLGVVRWIPLVVSNLFVYLLQPFVVLKSSGALKSMRASMVNARAAMKSVQAVKAVKLKAAKATTATVVRKTAKAHLGLYDTHYVYNMQTDLKGQTQLHTGNLLSVSILCCVNLAMQHMHCKSDFFQVACNTNNLL